MTSQDKASGKKEAERIRKGNKNFSGQGEGEGGGEGETKVQNLPKAFGKLKNNLVGNLKLFEYYLTHHY